MKLNYIIIASLIGIALLTASVSAIPAFGSNVVSGDVPLSVQFADQSTGTPSVAWNWSFGDGNFSGIKNPIHVYSYAGVFTVSLNVTNASASDLIEKEGYITVVAAPTPTPTATTVPTTVPTTIPTTVPTTVPSTVPTTVPTTIPTTVPTTSPTPTPTPNQTLFTPIPPSPDFMSIQTGNTVTFIDTSAGDGLNYWVWSVRTWNVGNWSLISMNKSAQTTLAPGKYEVYLSIRSIYFGQPGEKSIIKTVVVTPASSSGNVTVPAVNQSLVVFRPGNGDWFFDNNRDGIVDQRIHFGTGGDVPHLMDWNGDGVDDLVVFRPYSGNWYVDTNRDGQVDVFLHFGTIGDISLIGN